MAELLVDREGTRESCFLQLNLMVLDKMLRQVEHFLCLISVFEFIERCMSSVLLNEIPIYRRLTEIHHRQRMHNSKTIDAHTYTEILGGCQIRILFVTGAKFNLTSLEMLLFAQKHRRKKTFGWRRDA